MLVLSIFFHCFGGYILAILLLGMSYGSFLKKTCGRGGCSLLSFNLGSRYDGHCQGRVHGHIINWKTPDHVSHWRLGLMMLSLMMMILLLGKGIFFSAGESDARA